MKQTDDLERYFQEQTRSNPLFRQELQEMDTALEIAAQLYELRTANGLTQQQLAVKIGVKQSNIARWETPGYQAYTVRILSKLAQALGAVLNISLHTPMVRGQFDAVSSDASYPYQRKVQLSSLAGDAD